MPQQPLAYNVKNSKGAFVPSQADLQGNLATVQGHGKYYRSAAAGNTYRAANQTAATLSAGLATTYVGLVLSNPAASTANLVVQRAKALLDVAPAAFTPLGLITGWLAAGITVHTTPLTPESTFINNGVANMQGLVDAAATLVGTPKWADWFGAPTLATSGFSFVYDAEGEIIIPPGGYCAIGSTIAGPTSGFLGSFVWEEIPIASFG